MRRGVTVNEDETVIGRIATLISAFEHSDGPVGVSELGRRTGLPKSTAHRMIAELVRVGLLERDEGGVRLSMSLFEIGQRVPEQRTLRDLALPLMFDLREATHQTIHLGVLKGSDVVYVEILPGPSAPPLPSRVGGRVPAHATGLGKAILAFSPRTVVEDVIENGLTRVSSRTIIAPGDLLRSLAETRKRAVAFDLEESGVGVVCVASPIIGPKECVVGAISITGWSTSMRTDRMAPAVHAASLTLSRRLQSAQFAL